MWGYPGLIAPASLKHCIISIFTITLYSLSGVNRPGLIEANGNGLDWPVHCWLSGVNRPGLIEATIAGAPR